MQIERQASEQRTQLKLKPTAKVAMQQTNNKQTNKQTLRYFLKLDLQNCFSICRRLQCCELLLRPFLLRNSCGYKFGGGSLRNFRLFRGRLLFRASICCGQPTAKAFRVAPRSSQVTKPTKTHAKRKPFNAKSDRKQRSKIKEKLD